MMSQQVVIFGGTGFIGLHVVRACLAAGYRVSVVVRPSGNREYLLPFQHTSSWKALRVIPLRPMRLAIACPFSQSVVAIAFALRTLDDGRAAGR